jgi:hypothetical protein
MELKELNTSVPNTKWECTFTKLELWDYDTKKVSDRRQIILMFH